MTTKRKEPPEPLTASQRISKAGRHGPRRGANPRTGVKLEALTGPRGAWEDTQAIPPEHVELLAQTMIKAGADHRAFGAALCIAEDARHYVHAYRSWRAENDATTATQIEAIGQLAHGMRDAFGVMGERAELFIDASMREDQHERSFLAERHAIMSFLFALESAACKVSRPKRRPINAAAQNFLRGSIRTWRIVVGAMPSPPNRRMGDDERQYALHNILKTFVECAAGEIEERGQMMAQLNAKAFDSAAKYVRAEFKADGQCRAAPRKAAL